MLAQLFFCNIDTPISKPEEIIPFLGKGQLHWREGRSAYETAHSWFAAQDIPAEIRKVVGSDPILADAKLARAYFERQTYFDDVARGPSQTDVLAVLATRHGPSILSIEAKVDETFGPLVRDWDDGSASKRQRLRGLLDVLGLDRTIADDLRYQLFHRTAAALVEAQRFGAASAALIVQSFSPIHAGFTDFQAFARALGTVVERPGDLSVPKTIKGIRLQLGWATCPLRATPL